MINKVAETETVKDVDVNIELSEQFKDNLGKTEICRAANSKNFAIAKSGQLLLAERYGSQEAVKKIYL